MCDDKRDCLFERHKFACAENNRFVYTQATSICLIQSEVTELNSRKTTKRNSELFPSCLT
ncbi:hypothetical protein CTM83_13960 [Photobacterium leiognathi subsp. mandapamensis]|nr:hypothetical protein CTM83_13960 [Photobacterium leiognathi subsp. mandapamensis]